MSNCNCEQINVAVNLWDENFPFDLRHNDYLIIEDEKYGQLFSNQVAGTCCNHPEIKGKCVKVSIPGYVKASLWGKGILGNNEYNIVEGALNVDNFLPTDINGVEYRFMIDYTEDQFEAWITLIYWDEDGNDSKAILTWQNSD